MSILEILLYQLFLSLLGAGLLAEGASRSLQMLGPLPWEWTIALYLMAVIAASFGSRRLVFLFQTKIEPPKRSFLLDDTTLNDARIFDLASAGLFEELIYVPQEALKEEIARKFEAFPHVRIKKLSLEMGNWQETLKQAKALNATVLTTDVSHIPDPSLPVKVINLNQLSKALAPLHQTGEILSIKIQRYGKEPGQGVGYLEDGTMVVVNNGATSLGEIIQALVLSVKHTSSGRMIFCNAQEDLEESYPL